MPLSTDTRLLIYQLHSDQQRGISPWVNPALAALVDELQEHGDPRGFALGRAISRGFAGSPRKRTRHLATVVYDDHSAVECCRVVESWTLHFKLRFTLHNCAQFFLRIPGHHDLWDAIVEHRFAELTRRVEEPT